MSEDTRKAWSDRIQRTMLEMEPSATVMLYGSRARGDVHHNSDEDFAVENALGQKERRASSTVSVRSDIPWLGELVREDNM